jgi:hypothetical protein
LSKKFFREKILTDRSNDEDNEGKERSHEMQMFEDPSTKGGMIKLRIIFLMMPVLFLYGNSSLTDAFASSEGILSTKNVD